MEISAMFTFLNLMLKLPPLALLISFAQRGECSVQTAAPPHSSPPPAEEDGRPGADRMAHATHCSVTR